MPCAAYRIKHYLVIRLYSKMVLYPRLAWLCYATQIDRTPLILIACSEREEHEHSSISRNSVEIIPEVADLFLLLMQVKLDLLQPLDVPVDTPIDHGLASGRVAFACNSVPPIYSEAKAVSSGKVITPPLTLPTPGKADVVVTILGDPDGYEICYVEAEAFYQLAEPKYDVIDFAERAKRGGDGAAPPKSEKLQHTAGVTSAVTTPEEVADAVAAVGNGVVLLDFGAG